MTENTAVIRIDRSVLDSNAAKGVTDPPIAVSRSGATTYAQQVEVLDVGTKRVVCVIRHDPASNDVFIESPTGINIISELPQAPALTAEEAEKDPEFVEIGSI